MRTGGDLPSLYCDLVAAPEAWQPTGAKFKSPWDWAGPSFRALGRSEVPAMQATNLLNQLGQPVAARLTGRLRRRGRHLGGARRTLRRVERRRKRIARKAGGAVDARTLALRLLPGGALGEAYRPVPSHRAESGNTALALLLVSPEFEALSVNLDRRHFLG